ncbi:MAG: DinB family protein [Gemmataceae bacterium]
MNRAVIERFLQGAEQIRAAIKGLGPQDLHAFPIHGTWSINQIVVHLLDSDLIATHRMKRIIAENNPLLIGYDETQFAKSLFYDKEPLEDVLKLFELNRAQMGRILRQLPDAAFERHGTHNERGTVRLGELVEDYAGHVDHHLKFVKQKRELLGKK